MLAYILMGIAGVVVCSGYLSWFIYRFLHTILSIDLNTLKIIFIIIGCVLISLPAMNFFSLYAIIYYHLVVISMVLEIFNIFLQRYQIFNFTYKTGILSLIITVIFIGYGFYNMNNVIEKDINFSSTKVDNLQILQITDLHMGNSINVSELKNYVNKMNKLNADIVALTGDIVDESTSLEDMKECVKLLGSIKNTKGIYYVFGNHDAANYAKHPVFNAEILREEFENNGVIVLDDEVATIDNITIVGRKDASFGNTAKRKSTKELLKGVNTKNYILLLDHQPLELKENKEAGVDLQLSGHTHGGQIWPAGILEHLSQGTLVYGKYNDGSFHAYTSSGIAGWGYPIKTGAPSEYVLVKIK